MSRSKKILATCALTVGVLGAMASPALADDHAGVAPQDDHAAVAPQDGHAGFTTPKDPDPGW